MTFYTGGGGGGRDAMTFYTGGGGSDLPKSRFSVVFPIGLHVILQQQILKKIKTD